LIEGIMTKGREGYTEGESPTRHFGMEEKSHVPYLVTPNGVGSQIKHHSSHPFLSLKEGICKRW